METLLRSESLPVVDRFAWWSEMISHSAEPAVVTSDSARDFRTTVRQLHMGAARVSVLSHPSMRVRRSQALVRRSDPEFYHVTLSVRGSRRLSHCGRDAVLPAGDLMLYDSSHSFDVQFPARQSAVKSITIDLPRSALDLPPRRVEALLATPLPAANGAGALLSGFLMQLAAEAPGLRPQDDIRLEPVTRQLVTMFLAHHLDLSSAVPPEDRRQALMLGIRVFIEENLGNPELSPGLIAAAHQMSLRQLHRLFAQENVTVAAFVRRRRLERCCHDLADPALASRAIHAIAARWGFQRPADFTRVFRAAHGVPPSEYRALALAAPVRRTPGTQSQGVGTDR
ncbi:helix-turn-helix domain-containing protein [Streptomyces sp. PvR034]|uniref:AraC-like ligand-binding domain-containing protein n=1 Tax=Streptomyces sp. PvR034 TaxID=3156401 RepID=UPI003396A8CF